MMIDREMKTTINNWILQGKEAFLLTGARQIGKTYLIRECLKESKYDYIALNFIERPELVELFENATNAQDLLMRLSLITEIQLSFLMKYKNLKILSQESNSLQKKEVIDTL